uniref:Uncharacterized protein n=1 Tax=Salvator merianae TaxID=96440 RepID=A0A8D0BYQ6_SALMN
MEKEATLMRKGFDELQNMGGRKHTQSPGSTSACSKTNPSKTAEAIRQYYGRQAADQKINSVTSDYLSEIELLQKSFMRRPGCPEYNHQATSTSHLEGYTLKRNGLPSNLSTISLTSQLSLDDWNAIFSSQEFKGSKSFMKQLAVASTQSLCKLAKWRSCTEILTHSSQMKSQSRVKIPWYVAVLQEKDLALQNLGQKLTELSKCEAESARKDDIISILREEVEAMQKQLDQLQRGSFVISPEETPEKKSPEELTLAEGVNDSLRRRGVSLPIHWEQGRVPEEFQQELERLKLELAHPDETLESKVELLSQSLLEDQEQLDQLEKEVIKLLWTLFFSVLLS